MRRNTMQMRSWLALISCGVILSLPAQADQHWGNQASHQTATLAAPEYLAGYELTGQSQPDLTNDQGLTLLYSVPWPPQGLYFKQEVNSTADVEGVKFRAYNAATARVAELAGMIPAQIEAAELKQALATGVVSSFISSGSTGVDEKVWEDLTHFYDTKAWLPRNSIFVNTDAYNALPEASQKCLMDEAANAESVGTNTAETLAGGFLETLASNGMNVTEPGEALAADLSAIGETMTGEWLAEAGDDGAAIVDAFKN